MDLIKIGKFIKEQRKAKGLTQAELAEIIMVSEKTISKWECGNGFPDSSLILPLCESLEITANELLSGEKLSNEDYKKVAEENLVNLQSANEKSTKFLLGLEIVLGYMASATFFVLIFVASFVAMPIWARILLMIFGGLHFLIGVHFCLIIEKDAGYYECKHCGNKHIPTHNRMLWSMHCGRTRFMKCPKCNKTSWQKKVIK